jgi:hypothetical protein
MGELLKENSLEVSIGHLQAEVDRVSRVYTWHQDQKCQVSIALMRRIIKQLKESLRRV